MIFIQPSINPVVMSLGFIDIRWYSLAYIFAFILGSVIIKRLNSVSYRLISDDKIDKFFIWAIIGVILGGRIGYVLFYQTNLFFTKPAYILEIWNGGMSFHGGLIGMILSIYLFSLKYKIQFFYLSDLVSLVAPIGLFLGRISNFINTELYGRVTDFPLAIIYPLVDNNPRHPSQLYEAFFEGIILFLILLFYFSKKPKKYILGTISGLFLIFYSIFRFFIEYLREPDYHLGLIFYYFSMGQLLCIPFLLAGLWIVARK
ncbi:MAG: prolipoprotein diacylglyceryl transferase [Alphaproteobacteria bacterium]|nr:prolipoprotein diacylglyceryl transferase [Alphaproteobacteria bacterium]